MSARTATISDILSQAKYAIKRLKRVSPTQSLDERTFETFVEGEETINGCNQSTPTASEMTLLEAVRLLYHITNRIMSTTMASNARIRPENLEG